LIPDLYVKKPNPSLILEGLKRFVVAEVGGRFVVRNESEGIDELSIDSMNVMTSKDLIAGGISLSSHGSRHGKNGGDAIPDDALSFTQVRVSFGNPQNISVDANSAYTIPEGIYYVFLGPNSRVEVLNPVTNEWVTYVGSGVGLVFSDGVNVRIFNNGSEAETNVLLPIV